MAGEVARTDSARAGSESHDGGRRIKRSLRNFAHPPVRQSVASGRDWNDAAHRSVALISTPTPDLIAEFL
jgi:hypothetical protein